MSEGYISQMDRISMLRLNQEVLPKLEAMHIFEALEMCGTWALVLAVRQGQDNASIAEMFDVMKERMLRQADTFREAQALMHRDADSAPDAHC